MKKRPGIYFYCPPDQALRITSDPNPKTAGTDYRPWTIFFYFPNVDPVGDLSRCTAFRANAEGSKACASVEEALEFVLGDDYA